MPSDAIQKPVDHWETNILATAPPIEILDQKKNERKRKEMVGRLAERVLRLTKRSQVVAAVFAVNGLLSLVPQPSRKDLFEPGYGDPAGESQDTFEAKRDSVEAALGADMVREQLPAVYSERPASSRARRPERGEHRPPALEGFEEGLGLQHETVEQLLLRGYPRGFGGEQAVERLRYTVEHIPMHPSYGIRGYEGGHCTLSPGEGASEIVITVDGIAPTMEDTSRHQVEDAFGSILSHELAHASDWQNAASVAPEVRLNLLHRVLSRLESGEAISYRYVNRIRNPEHDEEADRLNRAREYFAELMSDAFRTSSETFGTYQDPVEALAVAFALRHDGDVERRLPDARLVVGYVRALDPSYDWEQGAIVREQKLKQLAQERGRFLVEQSIRRLHNPQLVDQLLQAFQRSSGDALRETPIIVVGLEDDQKEDEMTQELVTERLGQRLGAGFPALRDRLRLEWQEDVDRVSREAPAGTARSLGLWKEIVQTVAIPNDYADYGENMTHSMIAERVNLLNLTLSNLQHDPETLQAFQERAQQYLSVSSGHVMLASEDVAELQRYARAFAPRDQVRVASR